MANLQLRALALKAARESGVKEPSTQKLEAMARIIAFEILEEAANKAFMVADTGIVVAATIRDIKDNLSN